MTLFSDYALARRLEGLVAAEMRRFAETAAVVHPHSGAGWLEVAGGVAAFTGSCSPVNQAAGLGFSGPVLASDIEALEAFYRARSARPLVQVCPLAHASLWVALAEKGWVADGFENVLVRSLEAAVARPDLPEGVEIREATTPEQRQAWAIVAANGFSAPSDPTPEQEWVARIVVGRPGARLFAAVVDGCYAATGELFVEGRVGWLSADTTLPRFQRRGLQQLLQQWRLAAASEQGCDLAVTESVPGSASQRNQERSGFGVAYTKVDMVAPATSRGGS